MIDSSTIFVAFAASSCFPSGLSALACHRWRYTTPVNVLTRRCEHVKDLALVLAGDAFGGPRVEGAALSGLAAADALIEALPAVR